jgi:diguanylate cyclase (GGDEF)-like protein
MSPPDPSLSALSDSPDSVAGSDIASSAAGRPRPSNGGLLACVDEIALEKCRASLEAEGFEIVRAPGWGEALGLFETLRPEFVLVDGSFLDGSGPQLCAALRRLSGRSEVPVLAMCAGKQELRRALAAGASDVIGKPVDTKVLARRITALHRGFKASVELERHRVLLQQARRHAAEIEERFERRNLIDPLTGLPNRLRLHQLLGRALARREGSRRRLALFFLGLDRFTEINETLGRRQGDAVLRLVADRLAEYVRTRRCRVGPALLLVARLSSDEFALMLTDDEGRELSEFAQGALAALAQGFVLGDTRVYVSASIGVAVASADTEQPEVLIQQAETALYEAQRRGGGQLTFYCQALSGVAEQKLGMDRRLRGALERGDLSLHYQPIVQASDRRVIGAEALLRWNDAELGSVAPSRFVPVAEDTGLMTTIGTWVLEEACRQLRSWIDAGLPAIRMAVNVSRCQLERGDLVAKVTKALADSRLDPGLLELELSERGTLRNEPGVVGQLRQLKALGVRLMVDDFGTGQSAIAYLKQFPLDGLKVDRSFVEGVADREDDSAITSAIVAMAQRLNLDVVAEGVELDSQLQRLREYGCDHIQGFFYSPGLAPKEFRNALEARGVSVGLRFRDESSPP